MSDRFGVCHPITAAWEGGWSDHKADPGGKTMYGVTQAKFTEMLKKWGKPNRSVRTITMPEALRIYREEYWLKCGAPKLHPGVDLAVYDASVNSGVSRGKKWLKASVGSSDHTETVKKICRARLSFMQSLKIWRSFGNGWGRRVADIEARGVVMALQAVGATATQIKAKAASEAEAAKKASVKAANRAVQTTGGAAASGGATAADPTALWLLGIVFAILAAAAVILIIRKRNEDARAAAYATVAV